MLKPVIIDLAKHTVPGIGVLAGQDNGKEIRDRYKLDTLDQVPSIEVPDHVVTIVIPESVYSFNSSYFLGMLSKSVVGLGADEFRRRYVLTGPDADQTREKGIKVSLLTASPIRSFRRKTA